MTTSCAKRGAKAKHPNVFVVYNEEDLFVQSYVEQTWAERKAARIPGAYIKRYIDTNNRKLVEMTEFITRGDD